jgi:glycosyltransferase involved in cell wall biosynthesis
MLNVTERSTTRGAASQQLTYAQPKKPGTVRPLVSVVMAVRDGAATVRQSIDSILGQSVKDLELIVVDDGSRDGTIDEVAAVADERVHLISFTSPRGRSEARNEGIRRSHAGHIAIADADDVSLLHRIERQLEFLERHQDVTVLGGQIKHFGSWGGPAWLARFPTDPEAIMQRFRRGHMALAHPTVMFRRSVFVEVGLYFSECRRAEDLQLLLRTCGFGVIEALSDVIVHYRVDRQVPSWSYWRQSSDYRRYAVYSALKHRRGLVAEPYFEFSARIGVRVSRSLDSLRYLREIIPAYFGSRDQPE